MTHRSMYTLLVKANLDIPMWIVSQYLTHLYAMIFQMDTYILYFCKICEKELP